MDNYLTIPNYAKACGVSDQAIRQRLESTNPLEATEKFGIMVIDTDKFPPETFGDGRGGRPRAKQK